MDPALEKASNESQISEQALETPNYQFYETDEKFVLDIFDKDVSAEDAKVTFEPRVFTYENSVTRKKLVLQPLKGQIDVEASQFAVRKVKIEVIFKKIVQGRWGQLVGDAPDVLAPSSPSVPAPADSSADSSAAAPAHKKPSKNKNWDKLASEMLPDTEQSPDDPNAGGDAVVNKFFRDLYGSADDNTKKAMMKSFVESGGTTLSTNWEEVKSGKVEVKPPQGAEYKSWG